MENNPCWHWDPSSNRLEAATSELSWMGLSPASTQLCPTESVSQENKISPGSQGGEDQD